jgi:hypothetical protein
MMKGGNAAIAVNRVRAMRASLVCLWYGAERLIFPQASATIRIVRLYTARP